MAATAIEQVLTTDRQAQLDTCIPGADRKGLLEAMRQAARLGQAVCAAIAEQHCWPWPEELAKRIEGVLSDLVLEIGD